MSKSAMDGSLANSLNLLTSEDSADLNEVQNSFWKRLKTYIDEQRWVKQPLSLSPAVCASYGWKCASSQLLECVTCSAKLCTGQTNIKQFDSYKACVEKVQQCLKESHTKHCPWPLTPCPAYFIQMLPMHKQQAHQQFTKRLESLLILEDQLPLITDAMSEKLGVSKENCISLRKLSHVTESNYSTSAILLASTGWTRESEMGQKKCIMCQHCQRTVSLMFYLPVSSTAGNLPLENEGRNHTNLSGNGVGELSETKSDVELVAKQNKNSQSTEMHDSDNASAELSENGKLSVESESKIPIEKVAECNNSSTKNDLESNPEMQPPAKKRKLSVDAAVPFDPLYEHRPWCLWVNKSGALDCTRTNGDSEAVLGNNGVEPFPGWQLFINCLFRNIDISDTSPTSNSSPSKEEFSNARSMLETWGTPI